MVAKIALPIAALLCVFSQAVSRSPADEPATAETSADAAQSEEKYLLRYKFTPGEVVRWNVEHKARVRTTVQGSTQTADTTSISVKRWQIEDVAEDGSVSYVHWVDRVDMRQQLTGREAQRYNSETDSQAPVGYENVAKAVGVPLTAITIDDQGNVKRREEKHPQPGAGNGPVTIPLPAEAVPVGHTWTREHDLHVRLADGSVKTIQTRQQFRLKKVENGVATIGVATQFLTPVRDPQIQVQLIQHDTSGAVRFDIDAGRVIWQQTELDERVVGFSGEASSMHYVTRFTEKLLADTGPMAARPAPTTR
jgi:hypothetical protein